MAISKPTRNFVFANAGDAYIALERTNGTNEGERDFGDTPAFNLTIETELFEDFDSDGLTRRKVISEVSSVTRSGTLTVKDVSPDNLALFFGATAESISQGSATVTAESVDAATALVADRHYQLGKSTSQPMGARAISALVVRKNNGANEVQTITIDATGGTFTVTFDAQTTSAIAYDAAASALQSALEGLSSIGAGNVAVTKAGDVFTVTFQGALAKQNVPEMTTDAASLTGGAETATVATVTPGAADTTYTVGTDYEQDLDLGRIRVLSGGSLAGEAAIVVDYTRPAKTIESVRATDDVGVKCALRFVAKNKTGTVRDIYIPRARLSPSGEFAAKSADASQQMTFEVEVLEPSDGAAPLYINGRAA